MSMFSSALSYLKNAAAERGAPSGAKSDHELVGNYVEIGGLKLRIRYLIAEGWLFILLDKADAD